MLTPSVARRPPEGCLTDGPPAPPSHAAEYTRPANSPEADREVALRCRSGAALRVHPPPTTTPARSARISLWRPGRCSQRSAATPRRRPGNLDADTLLTLLSHRIARLPTAQNSKRFPRLLHQDHIFPQFKTALRTAYSDRSLLSHSSFPVRCSQAARLERLRRTIASTRPHGPVQSFRADQTSLRA